MEEKEVTWEELCELSVSSQKLADLLGLSQRHVERLAKEGVLIRQPDRSFNLVVNARLYLAHLQKRR
ncbi:hypothetical protein Anamo_0743 [Acetomicrobium mobile DSM 13181]|uniref:Helix-turn-helix domain-containing protein n=1 Tax=Acetomicrobium mobile (strain ATCC BAA-54 / DSM 13181 / JCM 12221 / NGA) TaxID=891968 RepID=I4BVS9_ACEMN|nr:hypothetical protein [Acetomicrobium mobile]AFM21386.1 hypothetical protein Anamo_0743 [Acetomicrobium mobile DSM 13181]